MDNACPLFMQKAYLIGFVCNFLVFNDLYLC